MTKLELRRQVTLDKAQIEEEHKRLRLLLLLISVFLLLLYVGSVFFRYLLRPAPLPDLMPVSLGINYPPHYLFSIYGVDTPVGVTVNPEGDRIYVAESGGERLIKAFDRNGNPVTSFSPPRTNAAQRAPVYLALDDKGNLFVSDRLQHAIYVYDLSGTYLNTMLGPDLTLSEFVATHLGRLKSGTTFAFNLFEAQVTYQPPGESEQTLPGLDQALWAPLGLRIGPTGALLMTDVVGDDNAVIIFPADDADPQTWADFNPRPTVFGETGQGNGQFLFPNTAVADSQGHIYISDGNNGRISTWDRNGTFLFNFGQGSGEAAISLPRGTFIDSRDRLYVVDAVGQNVKVFDVSGPEPNFLFTFGAWGMGNGQFIYPNDIALDETGRLYIADRENHRIQVWSY